MKLYEEDVAKVRKQLLKTKHVTFFRHWLMSVLHLFLADATSSRALAVLGRPCSDNGRRNAKVSPFSLSFSFSFVV